MLEYTLVGIIQIISCWYYWRTNKLCSISAHTAIHELLNNVPYELIDMDHSLEVEWKLEVKI